MPNMFASFLFNADADGVSSWYGGVFDSAFLKALSQADVTGRTSTFVLRGDILILRIAERMVGVGASGNTSTQTFSHDPELAWLISWDLVECLSGRWHTVNLDDFALALNRKNIYCISLPSVDGEVAVCIDKTLRRCKGYLGGVHIDLGNPVQKALFCEWLVRDAAVVDGLLILEHEHEDVDRTEFEGSGAFKPNGHRYAASLDGEVSPIQYPAEWSLQGERSASLYKGKFNLSLQERMLLAISKMSSCSGQPPVAFDFHAIKLKDKLLEADLPSEKFLKYLLNMDHDRGKEKAKFFSKALGIEKGDWLFLAAQFYRGLLTAQPTNLKVGEYGLNFDVILTVTSRNGRKANVRTGWIMKPGQVPQLVTAFPAEKGREAHTSEGAHLVVHPDLQGDAKWKSIFDIADAAGIEAAEATVPTPMKIEGYEVIMEGMFGFAWIKVPDARRGFARWLVRSGRGHRDYKSGASYSVSIQSHSIDRKVAYARAFAEVLVLNGVECVVRSQLD